MAVKSRVVQEWMSVAECEELTGRSQWTWRRDAYAGVIPSSKIGNRLYLRRADVEAFMSAGMRPALQSA
jgi:hypothetical protein